MTIDQFKHNNAILMLALDHRGSFQKILNPENPNAVSTDDMIAAKKQIIDSVSDQFSGLLVDSATGLKAYPDHQKPFLLAIEKTGYVERDMGRVTELEYTADELKEAGASGIKLLIYFNPSSPTAKAQLATAEQVLEDSHRVGLPLFLEIVTYDEAGKLKGDIIIESVQMFLDAGISADVFKLDYPGDSRSCARITELLGSTPWILLTRGGEFDTFKTNLQDAVANGAIGFLAGRSLWQEIASVTGEARETYLSETVAARFREIAAVVTAVTANH